MRRRRASSCVVALAVAGASVVASAPARAQDATLRGIALNHLDPAPAGDPFFSVPSALTPGHLELRAYVMFDYASQPLRTASDPRFVRPGSIVSDLGYLRADVSFTIVDRLMLSLQAPVAVLQNGDDPIFQAAPSQPALTLRSPKSVDMGDLRAGVRARLFGEFHDPFQLAVGGYFYVPTAPSGSYAGEGAFRAAPHLLVSGQAGRELVFRYALTGGAMVRTSGAPHSITYGAALGLAFAGDRIQIGPEFYGSTTVGDAPPLFSDTIVGSSPSATTAEILGGIRGRLWKGLFVGAAAGPGLTNAPGSPTFRVLGALGWAPWPEAKRAARAPDADDDGVPDADDACRDVPGIKSPDPKQNGCPIADRDGDKVPDSEDACPDKRGRRNDDASRNGCPADYDRDGIADADDACPNQKGVASTDPKKNGCPGLVDADLDGVADADDACPSEKGPSSADPAKNGCPPPVDTDGDGIFDREDACPAEKGKPDKDKTKHGCPKDVRVNGDEIVILKQVQFKFAQASISQTVDPVSDDLLGEVRDVITQHPEIKVIEVQGHTDNVGGPGLNMQLSVARASAVRDWLVQKGIAPGKLVVKGYGDTKPVASNDTEDGRQKNRRVQFFVLKREDKKKPK